MNQLTLGAGTYTVTNAAGLPDANPINGWNFDSLRNETINLVDSMPAAYL